MFNFNLQNRAFEELNAEQFRIIYFLNNTLSMVNEKHNTPNNDKVEIFNGYMMDKLGLSVRMIQYHIKALEQLGYITVERPIGRNAAKKPNIITLNVAENNAINCALYEKETTNSTENSAINCTLNKKEIIKNKNIYKYTSTITTSTCSNKENIKEKINKKESELNDSIIQPKGVNNPNSEELSNLSDDEDKSKMKRVNKKLIDMKENEMSDNGTSEMNAKSEMKWNGKQGSNNVAECGKNTITSIYGENNKTSTSDNKKHTVQNNRGTSDSSIFIENCSKPYLTPQIPQPPLSSPNKAAGEPRMEEMDNLSTQDNKTQQEALKYPQIEFNREEMLRLMDMSANETDLDRFKEQLRKMDEYMQWLKLNDRFQYKLYVKEIYCWFKSHTWNMEFDFISLGGEFMRKYVA